MSFEKGQYYKCEKTSDDGIDYYDVLDESGEWYMCSASFFNQNFEH